MGLYDSIYLKIKCPKCKQESLLECQTKELECSMDSYFLDDFVPINGFFSEITQTKKLYCVTECRSFECYNGIRMPNGEKSGTGHIFRIYIIVRGGKITGEYIHIGEA